MTSDVVAAFRERVDQLAAINPVPTDIADVLRGELTAEEKVALCDDVMVMLVRDRLRLERDLRRSGSVSSSAVRPGPSKAARVAEWYRRLLTQILSTGPNPEDYKPLGECTFDDLMFAVAVRREQAAKLHTIADNLEGIAALLRQHNALRVADIPQAALEAFINGGAAA